MTICILIIPSSTLRHYRFLRKVLLLNLDSLEPLGDPWLPKTRLPLLTIYQLLQTPITEHFPGSFLALAPVPDHLLLVGTGLAALLLGGGREDGLGFETGTRQGTGAGQGTKVAAGVGVSPGTTTDLGTGLDLGLTFEIGDWGFCVGWVSGFCGTRDLVWLGCW